MASRCGRKEQQLTDTPPAQTAAAEVNPWGRCNDKEHHWEDVQGQLDGD